MTEVNEICNIERDEFHKDDGSQSDYNSLVNRAHSTRPGMPITLNKALAGA